ncbi:Mdj2 [Kluyveromyces lactis]|nr:Mdj2 [Kluyveromyces lactis]
MVLPIIVGIGITTVAVVARSGLRAWDKYCRLTPLMIARLNNIHIPFKDLDQFGSKYRTRISPELLTKLDRYPGGFYDKMSETEALLILGISAREIEALDERLLRQKHRRAMIMNHPDKGGSPFLASKINQARDLLANSVILKGPRD